MEVSGRKSKAGNDTEKFCQICNTNGQRRRAFGYCQNCKSYHCDKCSVCHRKDKRSNHHGLERKFSVISNDALPPCETHKNEEIKFYCREHEVAGCIACMMSHKECDTNYIQELSGQFSETEEFLNLENCLEDLKVRFSEALNKVKENASQVEKDYQIATDAIKALKTEIIDCLDKFEHDLQVEAMAYKKTNDDKIISLQSELDDLHRDTIYTDVSITKLKKEEKYNALFLEVKRAAKRILYYNQRLYEISTRNSTSDMRFIPTTKLETILTRESIFGRIEVATKKVGPCNSTEYLQSRESGQINIKSETDKRTCYVTGLVFLSADQLAVADKANKNVKIVDVSYDKMISEITLSSSPRDMTVVPPNQLAVTLRDEERIQLLSTTKGLTKVKQIRTVGSCRGISYDDGKLIVVFDNKS